MYKNVLESISGIEIYPIISLTIFFTVFAVMIWWVVKRDKRYIEEMASLPLDGVESHTAEAGLQLHNN